MARLFRTTLLAMLVSGIPAYCTLAQEATDAPEPGDRLNASETETVDPSGSWRWQRDFGDDTVDFLLKLNWDGEKLTGEYTSFDSTTKIEDAKLEGDQLSFYVEREFNGNEFDVDFTGKVKEDQIDGTTTVDFGGEPRDFEWQAKRSVEPSDVVGTWKLHMETPNGPIEPEITLKETDGKLQGNYSSVFGEREATNVSLEDNVLSWEISGENDNFTFKTVYKGKPRGNKIAGTSEYDFNGNTGSLEFTGEKQAEEETEEDANKKPQQEDEPTGPTAE